MIAETIRNFFVNKLSKQSYNRRKDKKVLSPKISNKERNDMPPNQASNLFSAETKTVSAPDHSVCYMMNKGNNEVQLIVSRYGGEKKDLEGSGKVFSTLDIARAYAFQRGYILPDLEEYDD
jgi:hypothetical protein